jgi:hypothetical protein
MNANQTEQQLSELAIVNTPSSAYKVNGAEIEAAMDQLAPVMSKLCELVARHPEWRIQSGTERVTSILRELRKL